MQVAVFQFSMFGINTYLVFDPESGECAVIDPGMSTREEEKAIDNFIFQKGLKLKYIINTHLHIDHVVGIPYLSKKYEAPLLASKEDEFLGERIKEQAQMFGLPLSPEPIKINRYLKNGDIIKLGHSSLEVIEVPGHSRGGLAFYDKADGFLISGDSLFQGSIGRTDLPGGNYEELISNIHNRLLSLPDETVVYPGHGPSTTIRAEKIRNPFLI